MAGFDPQVMLGGGQETLSQAPGGRNASAPASRLAAAVQPHHGLVVLVLFAVLVVFVLDRAGFRFAVAVGRQ